jgi:hypothetical protein
VCFAGGIVGLLRCLWWQSGRFGGVGGGRGRRSIPVVGVSVACLQSEMLGLAF